MTHAPFLAIGLMSGTSMDGVDAVLMRFDAQAPMQRLAHAHRAMPGELREELLALNAAGANELHRASVASIALVRLYAEAVTRVLADAGLQAAAIDALGAHGQTVRHHPQAVSADLPHGYTLQLNQPALLAELTGITVVADLRARDLAAGGQGAPLVPAFHQAWLGKAAGDTVVLNWGGIANISILEGDAVRGLDTGPANALLDLWCERHLKAPYDRDGAWAATGRVQPELLQRLLAHPFFARQPPKSTGRDDFHLAWLTGCLQAVGDVSPVDVQATLAELTAQSTADAIVRHAPAATRVILCGGGSRNGDLVRRLQRRLPGLCFETAEMHGLASDEVEAAAFAWLAWRCCQGLPGNLPSVTHAQGPRILGAIYPR
ncbi:anhydro-N-acetylmuramic acid kinase [Comamonas serinivorans]|uniref:Anhydro-N-acetylmuramic acid kinase n=1 Tax=Comamonas serinivorans TaxID=1082851 RepID=A0A1Y0ERQ2_9BURK|nr:anhydro-N-acetylmuramic acid kinase [Comamonas serinivorans]ARU06345.1 anhydro-N-acetylmuramic acid kinase [Comamonas serinivorans]